MSKIWGVKVGVPNYPFSAFFEDLGSQLAGDFDANIFGNEHDIDNPGTPLETTKGPHTALVFQN